MFSELRIITLLMCNPVNIILSERRDEQCFVKPLIWKALMILKYVQCCRLQVIP